MSVSRRIAVEEKMAKLKTRPIAKTGLEVTELGLYVAKGCVGCHVHGAVTGYVPMNVGPNLTPKRYQADYLAKLLVDPSIARTPGQQNQMPKLGLKPAEITALVAFINADRQVSSR